MTTITITKSYIEVSGHSGDDRPCNVISAITQFMINSEFMESCLETADGYYRITDIDNMRDRALEVYISMMKDLEEQFPENVKVEVFNELYGYCKL